MKRKIPYRLRYAYAWTEAAGELDQLRQLSGAPLRRYCSESVANHDAHCGPGTGWDESLDSADIEALQDWLLNHAGDDGTGDHG